ncbi:MAG: hypothetical protein IPN96_18100 [Anaerolineales bacterium]|nr:hypothetical protein [Anaerolineales bacterium]
MTSPFAGQSQTVVLNVRGVDGCLQAIWSIWSSSQSKRPCVFWKRIKSTHNNLSMDVIIQDMSCSQSSGVALLSRKPRSPVQMKWWRKQR